ncbi:MAG TPA: DUF1003 domain-containing protein [Blastocatellia bacterium]|nr:DUF1003 domain-containing protein [Blastocatellia bacterium]HMV85171.1 DUF1003 domain-containing protein [Blastocatellia bacterium]HMX26147.1 DUF1003 domain-containing protein [Blastocatellia bacterium]HMY71287.1 DUF1003 domain-containing protein [Blastocatellia bacterium]HMZ20266.1 DUF1003 domain-containing protein [Blastocatellia bacterium]
MTDQSLKTNRLEIARKLLETEIENLHPDERQVVEQFVNRGHVARNVLREFDEKLTFGQRVADQVANFGGSWTFIFIFLSVLVVWMLFNTFVLARQAFDPYPYILLNLLLSCLAALQAPVIMMSQNRMAEKDRVQAKHDYEVNIKAELEILQIQEKINELRERDWIALIEMQQRQIELLERLLAEADARAGQR